MTRKLAVVLLIILAAILLMALTAQGQAIPATDKTVKAAFSAADRKTIDVYYTHLIGTLAPGSLDRSDFPVEIEKVLRAGGKVPLQLEKKLEPLPRELETKVAQPPAGFGL